MSVSPHTKANLNWASCTGNVMELDEEQQRKVIVSSQVKQTSYPWNLKSSCSFQTCDQETWGSTHFSFLQVLQQGP